MFNIMVIKIDSIKENSVKVQSVLARFNCSIKTRLGIHEAGDVCGTNGVIILNLAGDEKEISMLETALNKLENVKAKIVIMD